MVTRIQEIIKRYDLTPSKLADTLDVPRSTISHILSERNKPSLEFIQKIIDKFPEINIKWLLRGEGNIVEKERDLFSDLYAEREKEVIDTGTLPPEISSEKPVAKADEKYENVTDEKNDDNVPESVVNKEIKYNDQIKTANKKIVKIFVFYDNGTFKEYNPAE
ncbi:MAG: helix-turn-helix domain-containing protein [Bacteroidales bacterium]